jgi:hypothetical protein
VTRELMLWLLLSACTYRATRLITKDTFPPVLWVRDRLAGGWRKLTEAEAEYLWEDPDVREIDGVRKRYLIRAKWSPFWLAELITCPWCASAYVSGAMVGITDCVTGVQWPWLMGGAVWAGASLLASRDWA